MSDFRQDAIEAIKKEIQDFEANYMHGEDDENYSHDIGFVAGLHRAKTFIRSLPSADATIGDYPNDLISRSALMEYCSNQKSKSIDNNDIARFPSADRPQGEWTPVCAELPNMGEDVLASLWGEQLEVGYFAYEDLGVGLKFCTNDFEIRGDESVFEEVDAWMPLPAPYKGGDEE